MADDDIKEKDKKQKEGGAKKLILIVIVAIGFVVILVVGILAGVLLFSPSKEAPNDQISDTKQPQTMQKKPNMARYSDFMNIGPMYPMDQFVVNLLSESGSRYLKTSIDFELSIETLVPEMDKKKPVIRDIIIRALSSKTIEDISTTKGKERLKDEIVSKINEILTDGHVKNAYFTDFIIQ